MGDNKEFFCFAEDGGTVKISSDVIAAIAAASCVECEGVAAIANVPLETDFYELFLKKGAIRGVKVAVTEGEGCKIDINLYVLFGSSITDVAEKVQTTVKTTVEGTTGVAVLSVNVFVTGVTFKK